MTNGISKRAQFNEMQDVKSHSLALQTPASNFANSFPLPSEQPFVDSSETWSRRSDLGHNMDLDVPIDTFDTSAPNASSKGKRRVSSLLNSSADNDVKVKPRTLGGDRPVEVHVAKKISTWTSAPNSRVDTPRASGSGGGNFPLLPTPSLLTYLSSEVEGSGDILEAKNIDNDGAHLLP
jgi:protein HIRA/HIR1